MTTANIISFINFLKSENAYFDNGYGIAFKDESTKKVFCHDGLGLTPVMPVDTSGNYFYLRYEKGIEFTASFGERLADNNQLNITYQDRMNVILVACVRDADELKLLENLRVTCAKYTGFKAIPTSTVLIPELVVANELSGMPKEDLEAALQRLTGWTIISMNIGIVGQYYPSNCVINPCKSC